MALRPTLLVACLVPMIPLVAADGPVEEPPHAAIPVPYASRAEALSGKRGAASFSRSLDGDWRFHWSARAEDRPVDFYKPEYDVSAWDHIPVPSNWESRASAADTGRASVGSYRRAFEVPAVWRGRRVFVSFAGVDGAFSLWVDGRRVGGGPDSQAPSEFDVTPFVAPGANTLAVEVRAPAAGRGRGGIFRGVTLWSTPEIHVSDLFVRAEPDAARRDALLSVTARVRNLSASAAPARTLAVDLSARGGRVAGAATVGVPALDAGAETAVSLAFPVTNPAWWSAEAPNLYTVIVTMSGGGRDRPGEVLAIRTGFRRVEIRDSALAINGAAVRLHAARPLATWPAAGTYVSDDSLGREIERLKQANANYVNASLYAGDPRLYELCDSYGLYVVAEAGEATFRNYKNHPSLIAWFPPDERGDGGSESATALDPSRPVQPLPAADSGCGGPPRACQWIAFEPEDVAAGKIRVRNDYAFTNLDRLAGTWTLTRDGETVERGTLERLRLAPGETAVVRAPFRKFTPRPGAEYRLRIAFALARNEAWAKAGFEVAAGEFTLPNPNSGGGTPRPN